VTIVRHIIHAFLESLYCLLILKGRDTSNFSLMPGDEDVKSAFRRGTLLHGMVHVIVATSYCKIHGLWSMPRSWRSSSRLAPWRRPFPFSIT